MASFFDYTRSGLYYIFKKSPSMMGTWAALLGKQLRLNDDGTFSIIESEYEEHYIAREELSSDYFSVSWNNFISALTILISVPAVLFGEPALTTEAIDAIILFVQANIRTGFTTRELIHQRNKSGNIKQKLIVNLTTIGLYSAGFATNSIPVVGAIVSGMRSMQGWGFGIANERLRQNTDIYWDHNQYDRYFSQEVKRFLQGGSNTLYATTLVLLAVGIISIGSVGTMGVLPAVLLGACLTVYLFQSGALSYLFAREMPLIKPYLRRVSSYIRPALDRLNPIDTANMKKYQRYKNPAHELVTTHNGEQLNEHQLLLANENIGVKRRRLLERRYYDPNMYDASNLEAVKKIQEDASYDYKTRNIFAADIINELRGIYAHPEMNYQQKRDFCIEYFEKRLFQDSINALIARKNEAAKNDWGILSSLGMKPTPEGIDLKIRFLQHVLKLVKSHNSYTLSSEEDRTLAHDSMERSNTYRALEEWLLEHPKEKHIIFNEFFFKFPETSVLFSVLCDAERTETYHGNGYFKLLVDNPPKILTTSTITDVAAEPPIIISPSTLRHKSESISSESFLLPPSSGSDASLATTVEAESPPAKSSFVKPPTTHSHARFIANNSPVYSSGKGEDDEEEYKPLLGTTRSRSNSNE